MDLSFTDAERAFASEIRAWLAAHLDLPPAFDSLDAEIAWGREWQAKLAAERWVGIHWPAAYGGRNATPVEVALYNMEYARSRALQPVNRVGINLAGPTLLAHGTDAQKARWLARILDASEIWCQLFSEPGAGSDLASLATRATPVDGGWVLSGQKVWTSYAQYARWGIALVRTDPDAPKHRGISYVVVDMQVPGIEIRPLVQITGEAEFNEVFFDDVFVPEDHLVGGRNDGWAVANTTLAHERGTAFPFKEQVVHEVYLDELYSLAAERARLDEVEIADALAQTFVELRLLRLDNWRTLSRLGAGIAPGAESSVTKLRWTDMTQHLSETALAILGPDAPRRGRWSRQWLWSKAASIAGGTSEVQRTIIGERMLGLPRREPPNVRIIGLDHVVFRVTDVERSLDFYLGTLGLEPVRVDEWRAGTVLFPSVRVDAHTIIDIFPRELAGEDGTTDATVARNVDHVCLVVEPCDLQAVADSGTFDVVGGPAELFGARGQGVGLYVRDPDGNVVELRHYGL